VRTFPYKRSERVKKLLHQKICKILPEIKDPGLGFVTITDVEVSDDLSESKIFFSVLGSKKEKEDTTNILLKAVGFVRQRLGEGLKLRNVPTINFIYDDSFERANKVFSLLDEVSEERGRKRRKVDR